MAKAMTPEQLAKFMHETARRHAASHEQLRVDLTPWKDSASTYKARVIAVAAAVLKKFGR